MLIQIQIEEPWLSLLRSHCLAKEGAYEDYPWDQLAFKVAPKGKMFCACAGCSPTVTVKSTLDKQAALIRDPSIEVASYIGKYGWVSVSIRNQEEFDLAKELIDESYDLVTRPRKR